MGLGGMERGRRGPQGHHGGGQSAGAGLACACACGEVRFRLSGPPMFVCCCHCRECQRHTGSAFVLNALIETDRIELVADSPAPVAVTTASGRPQDRVRG